MIIASKTVTITQPKGRPIQLTKGLKVTKSTLNKLSTRQKESYTVNQSRTRQSWTTDEIDLIAMLYHTLTVASCNHENANEIISSFREYYDTHTNAAIIFMIGQCKALDSRYDAIGLNYNKQLVISLESIDSDRYGE